MVNNMMSWAHCTACEDKDVSAVQFLIILARILPYTAKQNKSLLYSNTFMIQLDISFLLLYYFNFCVQRGGGGT